MARLSLALLALLLAGGAPVRTAPPMSISVPLTIQEAIYSGGTSGVARTDEPITVGIPLPDDATTGTDDVEDLALSGATAGQFRVLGSWPSGRIKWVLVDTILSSLSAGATNASITLTNGGGGNFGGSDLATDNGATITVATGAATFTLKKANHNGLDTVVVGSTTLVSTGGSGGFTVTGPSAGNSACGTCTTVYASYNDAGSTCSVEENGPVRAVVKCSGDHEDGSSNVYMHFTARYHFYKGKTNVKVVHALRNADYSASVNFTSAFKEYKGYEFIVPMALTGTTTYVFGTHSGATSTSTLSGTDDAYIYQGESTFMLSDYPPNHDFTTDSGYVVVKNGNTGTPETSGTASQPSAGWGNIQNASGAGVLIGHYQAAANYPKGLTFNDAGTNTRIGIAPTANTGEYFMAWPQYATSTFFLTFHAAALSSNANEFLRQQHYLIGRADIDHYNDAGVFAWKFATATEEDAYYTALDVGESPEYTGTACCLADVNPNNSNEFAALHVFRHYGWNQSGPEGQFDRMGGQLMQWLIRGMPGRYLNGAHFYGQMVSDAVWRSDGFTWLDHAADTSAPGGHPAISLTATNAPSDCSSSATCFFNDPSRQNDYNHVTWYGIFDYYFLTGDEGVKDAILDGYKDFYLAPGNYINTYQLGAQRGVGHALTAFGKFGAFLAAIGDADATDVQAAGDGLYENMVQPELCLSDTPTAACDDSFDPDDFGTWTNNVHHKGTSRTRGWNVASETRGTSNAACSSARSRVSGYYFPPIMAMGLMAYADYRGSSWADYDEALDLGYGGIQALDDEQWYAQGSNRWDQDVYRYSAWLDITTAACDPTEFYDAPNGQQTFGMAFYMRWRMNGAIGTTYEDRFKKVALKAMNAKSGPTGTVDYASAQWNAVIYRLLHPGTVTRQDVSFTPVHNGGGSYTLSWTKPTGAQSYRVKWSTKEIVDWIGFNAVTNSWTGDPTTEMSWMGATNVSTAPTCGSTTCTVTVSTGNTGLAAANFSVKAYVDSTVTESNPTTITWTKQSTPSGNRPNPTGYSTDHFSPLLGQAIYYQMPNGSNSIYASDIYAYNAATNTFTRHANSSVTMTSGQCPVDSPGTGTGRERTIAADGYVWPPNRHPEQTAYDTLRDAYWVYGGVCSNNFEDPAVNAGSISNMWRLNLNATFNSSTWTKVSITTNPAATAGALAQGAEMAHDPVNDVLVLYGAFKTFVFCPTTTTLSAAQIAAGCDTANDWQDVTSGTPGVNMPSAYFYPGMWYESSTQKIILFGGGNSADSAWYNEVWAYDVPTKTWTNKNPSGGPPAFVGGGGTPPHPPMAYDSTRNVFVYTQLTGTGAPQNWLYDPVANTWASLTANATPNPDGSVDGFSMTYDSVNDKFIAVVYNPSSDPTNNPSIWHGVLSGGDTPTSWGAPRLRIRIRR